MTGARHAMQRRRTSHAWRIVDLAAPPAMVWRMCNGFPRLYVDRN
jgi:hypothetical protein